MRAKVWTGKLLAVFLDSIRETVFCLTMRFVFNSICAAVFCLMTSSLSARCSAAVQLPVIQPLFYSPLLLIVSNSVSLVPIFPSTFLLLFSYSACSLSIIIQVLFSRLRSFVPKNIIFLFGKKSCKYRFRFVFVIKSVSVADYSPGPKFRCRAHEDHSWCIYIYI